MKDIVSSANKKNESVANMQHTHDFRNFWNYFFDFGNTGMENLEPKIDVVDNKDSVTIVAEIPGIKEDDMDIKISEDGYLTISGEKHTVKAGEIIIMPANEPHALQAENSPYKMILTMIKSD